MRRDYEEALASLNEEQRRAVETIDGPLLVVAGPGTGKTQLLSTRVSHILSETDISPQNILCLTFTNKAAVNMKERIIALAGPDGAKVAASTFHSFSAEIMNLYPEYFWNSARLSVAPDTTQLDIVESIVKGLPLDNPLALKFAGQYTLLKDIKSAIKLAKEAGLTPDKLRTVIKANYAYIDVIEHDMVEACGQRLSARTLDELRRIITALPNQRIDAGMRPLISLGTILLESLEEAITKDEGSGKLTNVSRWKSRWVQTVDGKRGMFKERERNDWWLQLASVYESYREALHAKGFYDYDDMLLEVINQLEQNPPILADVQERFSYVLIDEFQDTTPAQLRLAHLVADHHSAGGVPNLMAVGDDDQSIYKFNGADLNSMSDFKRSYPTAKIIILKDNYRSSQEILDFSKKIIEQANNRLVDSDKSLNKDLVAKIPPKEKGGIEAAAWPSSELQLSEIARQIKREFRPGYDIAVLARGHESLKQMAAILGRLGVPVRYEQANNTLDHEIVNQIYLLFKLLLAIHDGDKRQVDALIHQIIRWPAWEFEPRKLWDLALTRGKEGLLESLLASGDKRMSDFAGWVMDLTSLGASQPLAVTLEQLIGLRPTGGYESPIKTYFVNNNAKNMNSYFQALSAIQLLRALVKEFSAGSEPTILDFVRFIEINKENDVTVADESPFITATHAVQLLTVHKAKGLEFDHVFIIDTVENNWQPGKGGRKPPSNLPLLPALEDFNDYVRLMYVAATRAKSSITISAYYQDHAGKDVGFSTIVQGAIPVRKKGGVDKAGLIEVLQENLHWPDLSGGDEKQMLKSRLENYSLYATHLLDFLDVTRGGPQLFKERHLLNLPEIKTASLSYGSAMHAALEVAQHLTNNGIFSLTTVQEAFGAALKEERLDEIEHNRRLAQGSTDLARLFEKFGYSLPKGSRSEQKLNNIYVGKARIGGKLDRVDLKDDSLVIADYKTGNMLSSFETKDKNKAVRAYKHKMQLIFYALLATEEFNMVPEKIEGQMIYVQADTPKQLVKSYKPTQEDTLRLKALIAAVWQKIMKLDFPDTSKYSQDIDGIKAFEADLLGEGNAHAS